MKKICVLSVMLCTSTIALAAKPVMPKQFLGNWAESKDSCVIPKDSPIDFPGDGAKIRKDGIERYEYWCELRTKVFFAANNPMTVALLYWHLL